MLIVTVRNEEFITLRINNRIIKVCIKKHRPYQFRVGVVADDEVKIYRGELDLKQCLEKDSMYEERRKEREERLCGEDWE